MYTCIAFIHFLGNHSLSGVSAMFVMDKFNDFQVIDQIYWCCVRHIFLWKPCLVGLKVERPYFQKGLLQCILLPLTCPPKGVPTVLSRNCLVNENAMSCTTAWASGLNLHCFLHSTLGVDGEMSQDRVCFINNQILRVNGRDALVGLAGGRSSS